MIRGSCLCGQVRYALASAPQALNHCHCSMCRKAHGAAFGSFVHGDGTRFRWLAGADLVQRYVSSPERERAFCGICGSSMPVLDDGGAHVVIPAGTLDDDPGIRPSLHGHVASHAPWHEITDSLPQHDDSPP